MTRLRTQCSTGRDEHRLYGLKAAAPYAAWREDRQSRPPLSPIQTTIRWTREGLGYAYGT